MAAKYQLMTELYRRTLIEQALRLQEIRKYGRTFWLQPAITTNAALMNNF